MKQLGIGVIGCGAISRIHLESICKSDKASLEAVCDLKDELAKQMANEFHCDWYVDYHEILNKESIQAVHILLPHDLHTPVAIEALKAGKHVVLEKPVGITMDELEKLKIQAKESDLCVGVTLQNRFNPTTIEMKKQIESGNLGNLLTSKGFVTWHRDDAYYSNSQWRGILKREGGGLLINQAIHTLDLLRYIGGEIKSIQGIVANHHHETVEVEDTALVTLYYENGAVGNFYGTNNHGINSNVELEFVYEKGVLRLLDQNLYLTKGDKVTLIASDIVCGDEKRYWGQGHKHCIDNIYSSIIRNQAPFITLDEAIKATELVLGTYQSNRNHREYKMKG